ncbi:MAG TPA: carboxymuconolactone decarboxylase family protein [Pseudomonadales bacterium]
MNPSLAPVPEPFSEDVAAILAGYPKRDGYVLQLFRVFANSVRFLKKGTVNLLDRDSPLPVRLRELVILRVTANNDCEYEWGVHVTAFAAHVGFTEEQVAATRLDDHRASCWSPEERVLLRAVDELCAAGRIMPDTYRDVRRHFSLEQQLEILALAGNYHTVCFVANTAALPPEPFGARFPTPYRPMAAESRI